MNRNRLKENFKNKVVEERHLRLVYDEESELLVPYENEDELRILAANGEMYKLAIGYIGPTGEYEVEDVTDYCVPAECLMFNDEDYFDADRYIVVYPQYNHPTWKDYDGKLRRDVTVYVLQWNDTVPLGYKPYYMVSEPMVGTPNE